MFRRSSSSHKCQDKRQLALRRLSDAVARGERIIAVIRATGTSSDGKGPSVAVPQVAGQVKAIERAWSQARLSPSSADFIEAHATAIMPTTIDAQKRIFIV